MDSLHGQHRPRWRCTSKGTKRALNHEFSDYITNRDNQPIQIASPNPLSPPCPPLFRCGSIGTSLVLAAYTVRHYWFSLSRLFGAQRHPCASIVSADWPRVTIFVAAHNEEAVIVTRYPGRIQPFHRTGGKPGKAAALKDAPETDGTVGGIRLSALQEVGGWHDDVLAEDTDLTYRLLLGG